MFSKRTVPALILLLAASILAAAEPAGYRKPYFGLTKPGTWAKYTMKMPGFPDSFTTYTRLADEDGHARLETRSEFTTEGQASTSFNDYTLETGYSLEKDALDFGKAVVGMTIRSSGAEPMVMEPAMLENIRKGMSDYAPVARFVAAETVGGRACDKYTYSLKHPGNPVQLESGELWLSDTVPFGLVRQTGVTKDPSGKLLSRFEIILSDSGAGATPASTAAAKAAPQGPVTLADAFKKEQVELTVDILDDSKDGSRLRVTFKNKIEAPLKLVIPRGVTALDTGTPIDVLNLVSAAERILEIAPGKISSPIELTQTGSYRAVKGRFVVSIYEGTQLFSGGVTMDHVK
jgi:hypothetical protein